ncbi:MAG: FecR domain-containing protein [Fuerstiella sp.]|nr:FecR domain-containing protein [Fuerstiella sp.]MCP4855143.1 FecR domain-containing protein [Fuerstiella sp.]
MTKGELNLLHRYLDGAITPEELESLEDLLRTNAEARATLRSLATVDAKWQQLAADEAVAISSNRVAAPRRSGRAIPMWLTLSAIAASLIVGALGWFHSPEERAVERGIARVIRIDGEGQAGKDRVVVDAADLFAGDELTMQQGLIELAFRETGVHVIATAPLRMKLDSDQRVSLHEGQVKLVVPPQGVGFVVDTAQRKFVDLGTSFVVTASPKGSEVLVLDGQISVDEHDGTSEDLMHEGEFARFDRNGKLKKRTPSRLSRALPELSITATKLGDGSLRGVVLGYDSSTAIAKENLRDDVIGQELLPLIHSEFRNRAYLEAFKQGEPVSFRGIAGAFHEFPDRTGLTPYSREGGWMTWYHGQVLPPRPGRYRFWGYADNHLLVAIDGKPVFEGSRRDSPFKELGIPRTDNPSLPCLIAPAGFACSEWVELSGDSVRLDLLFGEVGGNITSGLLLIEREGDTYEETFWGQPKWPLFLTEAPEEDEVTEFERLISHLEEKTMGSFLISEDAIWKVHHADEND